MREAATPVEVWSLNEACPGRLVEHRADDEGPRDRDDGVDPRPRMWALTAAVVVDDALSRRWGNETGVVIRNGWPDSPGL